MIEKLNTKYIHVESDSTAKLELANKINELVDAVNELQENHAISERIRIDGLDDPLPENVQEPIKLYVCADGCVYDNLGVAKSHAASIFNPLPAGATTTDRVYLEQKHAPHTATTESADQYAEQRKWIGYVCRFWDDNSKITKHFGILTRIDEMAIVPYEADNGFWYCACEPVKPDDDIIYKGGDNG